MGRSEGSRGGDRVGGRQEWRAALREGRPGKTHKGKRQMVPQGGTQDSCHRGAPTRVPFPYSQTCWHLPPPVSWSRRRSASWPGLGPGPRGDGDARRKGPQDPEPTELRLCRANCQKQSRPAPGPPFNQRPDPRAAPKTPPLALPTPPQPRQKACSLGRRPGLGLNPRPPNRTRPPN